MRSIMPHFYNRKIIYPIKKEVVSLHTKRGVLSQSFSFQSIL